MKLSVKGCRGSIPVASKSKQYFGGNTSCYTVETSDHLFVIDAGTGFKNVDLNSHSKCFVLLSHFHHDHLQGLPFNKSLFSLNRRVTFVNDLLSEMKFKETLNLCFSPPYFPIDLFRNLPNIEFCLSEKLINQTDKNFDLKTIKLNHPGGSIGYRIDHENKSITCLCDNEFHPEQLNALLAFVENSDIVIWDGMFTQAELVNRKGWGHSSIEQAIDFFSEAKIKNLLISHHDPSRTDKELNQLKSKLPSGVLLAYEGLELEI